MFMPGQSDTDTGASLLLSISGRPTLLRCPGIIGAHARRHGALPQEDAYGRVDAR